jgi:protoporphyrinogen oxidase
LFFAGRLLRVFGFERTDQFQGAHELASGKQTDISCLIIGAGPVGLGAATRWMQVHGEGCLVVESSEWPGGLAASFRDSKGFTWDLGSHLQFSHYEYYDVVLKNAMPADTWNERVRVTEVWFDGQFIPYPFQLNLHRLQPQQRWECVEGLLTRAASTNGSAVDFGSWCKSTFGAGITQHFMRPYNEKLWACPLGLMASSWIADRVAVPEIDSVLRGICLQQDSTVWGPNAEFRYPKSGGSGTVWEAVASQLPIGTIRYGVSVKSIDAEKRIATFTDGSSCRFESCISAIPLTKLHHILGRPEELQSVTELRANSTHVVGVGLQGTPSEHLKSQCWSYFPDAHIPFYRLTVMSNLSRNNAPMDSDHWSLMSEVSEPAGETLNESDVRRSVTSALEELGFIQSDAIVNVWHRRLEMGYPVPTVDRDTILRPLNSWLESHDIYSRGRFGAWKYEVSNQDHCFMQGVEVVNRILHGQTEDTLNDPAAVNERYNTIDYAPRFGCLKSGDPARQ